MCAHRFLESFESCPSEEIFLLRLLKSSSFINNKDNSLLEFVEEALACRHLATVTLMKSLQEAISSHQGRSEYLTLALSGQKSNEGKKKKRNLVSCPFYYSAPKFYTHCPFD